MSQTTVLIVDDEPEIRDVIKIYLRNEGYSVIEAEDGVQALEKLGRETVQLVILDVMMPRMDGIQTCIRIRGEYEMPIIMLSAKGEDFDKITGLSIGADDYVAKPFNPLELVARVKAQMRRQKLGGRTGAGTKGQEPLCFGELVVDKKSHSVTVRGKPVSLTPTEFAILELLANHPGQVFASEAIYESVWKEPLYSSENTVMVHIRNIREKIELNPRSPQYIKTVWGVGYKIES